MIAEEVQQVVTKTQAKLNAGVFASAPKDIQFMYGHPVEITTRLQRLTNSGDSDKKFPLIALFTDIPVRRNIPGFYGSARLQIIIANYTEQNYDAADRTEKNFIPILRPIKEEFLRQVILHRGFSFENEVEFTEIERYYWGKQGLYGNTGNTFNDFIDCIELQNVEVILKNQNCIIPNNL